MKKILTFLFALLMVFSLVTTSVFASAKTHTVTKGESLWKIAVKYEVGISEIKSANPGIKNYNLIYPGDVINIPSENTAALSFEAEVIRLVNQKRIENGLSALKSNWELSRVARYKSLDMKNLKYFSHTSPTYGSPFEMIKNFGIKYKSAGENIARGYSSPEAVVKGWMNSPGHRANILNASFTEIGVGYVAEGNYCTQMFISR